MKDRETRRKKLALACVVSNSTEILGVRDILRSTSVYLKDAPLIVLNNSNDREVSELLEKLGRKFGNLRALSMPRQGSEKMTRDGVPAHASGSGFGSLTWSVFKCMEYALDNLDFEAFLKIDPDSLIIGRGLDLDICGYLEKNPRAGLLGSYKRNCNGVARDFSSFMKEFSDDALDWDNILRRIKERNPEFVPGEHVQGGGEAYSRSCIEAIVRSGPFSADELDKSILSEDVVFSTITMYLGFEIHGFSDPGFPFAIAWRGLPMSVLRMRLQGKALIHSIKFDMASRTKRRLFGVLRAADRIFLRGDNPDCSQKAIVV